MLNFVLIFTYLILGYLFSKTVFYKQSIPNILNKLVIYISLPAMILLQIPKLQFSSDNLIPVVIAWSVIIVSAFLVIVISRFYQFTKDVEGALLLVVPLGNTSFLGIPIIEAYYGDVVLPYVLIYDQLGSFLALATYGTFIVSYYSSDTVVSGRVIIKKLFTFPPFLFLLIAFLFIGVEFNATVEYVLSIFSSTIVPFALLAVGMQLKLILPKNDIKPLSIALLIKLMIAPLIAIIICKIFNWNNEIAVVSIMEAGMAPMITAGVMASMAGIAPRLVSAILGYGIVLSFITTYLLYISL